jgi:hypothetical protein
MSQSGRFYEISGLGARQNSLSLLRWCRRGEAMSASPLSCPAPPERKYLPLFLTKQSLIGVELAKLSARWVANRPFPGQFHNHGLEIQG